ncbi:MAG: response regulator, partial [Gammaproteobacteria bacterium]|nr:response regulator [Gammaproteobacteria bacterium]
RESAVTKDIPVVFLSSHSSLRDRMQGYEVGADDFLVKPFETADLVAKMMVLAKYLEDEKSLKTQFEQASKTAYMAMTSSSEIGLTMQFVEKSYGYHNFQDLADAMFDVTRQYQINCALMILPAEGQPLWFSPDDPIKPLEKEMMEMLDRKQRFTDFGTRTIINYHNLSLLVKNMPLDDMERYGRIKDLLPMLLAAVDSKINAINSENALSNQSEELLTSFGVIKTSLYHLTKTLMSNQSESTELLQSMVTSLNSDLLGMGLEEDQETYILEQIDSAIEDAKEQIDASDMLYVVFSSIHSQLKNMTAKQQQLVDTFAEINAANITSDEVDLDDGSIEMF